MPVPGPKKPKGDEQVSSERYHEVLMDQIQGPWWLHVKWGATGEFGAKERHDQSEICCILKGYIWLQY